MKAIGVILFLSVLAVKSHGGSPHKVTLSTFNIKWFGVGGAMWNDPSQEFRQESIGRFVREELGDSDVIVFSEIVKTETLKQVVAPKWECVTYEGAWSRHQHTMICYKPKKFRVEKYDTDYIIPEVSLGSGGQRPATQAKLCHLKGKCFLQILGVHLAAGKKTEKRKKHINRLSIGICS